MQGRPAGIARGQWEAPRDVRARTSGALRLLPGNSQKGHFLPWKLWEIVGATPTTAVVAQIMAAFGAGNRFYFKAFGRRLGLGLNGGHIPRVRVEDGDFGLGVGAKANEPAAQQD